MSLLLIGLNHRTAPVEVRERLAFSREGAAAALLLFRNRFPGAEAAILSTCNRVEILVNSDDGTVGGHEVERFLSQARDVPAALFRQHLYRFEGSEAIRQVFRVAGGLDSMVVGESQIANQLKQAYQLAHEQGTAGPVLHRLFHHAFGVGKRLRSETAIGDGKTSVASVAADVVRDTAGGLDRKRVLVVGAGEMAQLAVQYLKDAGAAHFVITTRTLSNAKTLADVCDGEAVPFADLDAQIPLADVIITATNCPTALLTADRLRRCAGDAADRPLLLVDLAVPRNIAPDVTAVGNVTLYDVDALGRIVQDVGRQRAGQVSQCEQIIAEEAKAFEGWIADSRLRPLIGQMYEDVRALAQIEVRSMFRRCPDLGPAQRSAVEQLVDRVIAKLMHPCVSAVRGELKSESAAALARAWRAMRLGRGDADTDRPAGEGCPRKGGEVLPVF